VVRTFYELPSASFLVLGISYEVAPSQQHWEQRAENGMAGFAKTGHTTLASERSAPAMLGAERRLRQQGASSAPLGRPYGPIIGTDLAISSRDKVSVYVI